MKNLFIFTFVVAFVCLTNAQENVNHIPPSPESQHLINFNRIPTDIFNGQPNVNIDLFEFEIQGMKASVNLKYHYTGFKPSEVDSKAGIGWVLNHGGIITRDINGIADDDFIYGRLIQSNNAQILSINQLATAPHDQEFEYLRGAIYGERDLEYDIFTYVAGEESGSFFLERDGNGVKVVKLDTDNSVNITPIFRANNKIDGFEVILPSGIRYIYGKHENGAPITESLTTNPERNTTGWFLTQMIDYNNLDTIQFNYVQQLPVQTTRLNVLSSIVTDGFQDGPNGVIPFGGMRENNFIVSENKFYLTYYIDNISWRGGKVSFQYTGKYLDKIEVRNNRSELVKNYQFYFSNAISGDTQHFRKLDRVTNFSSTFYKFHYTPSSFTLDNHPMYYRTDWLGYYNGSNQLATQSFQTAYSLEGAARNVDSYSTKLFALEKILYATGGSSTFQWENNRAIIENESREVPGLRIKKIEYSAASDDSKSFSEEFRYGKDELGNGKIGIPYSFSNLVIQNAVCLWQYPSFIIDLKENLTTLPYIPTFRNLPNNICYPNVSKYIFDKSGNIQGKEVFNYLDPIFEYDGQRDQYLANYWFANKSGWQKLANSFPITENIRNNKNLGRIREHHIFRFANNVFEKIRSILYEYDESLESEHPFVKVSRLANYSTSEYDFKDFEKTMVLFYLLGGNNQGYTIANFHILQPLLKLPLFAYKHSTIKVYSEKLNKKREIDYFKNSVNATDSIVRNYQMFYIDKTKLLETQVLLDTPSNLISRTHANQIRYSNSYFSIQPDISAVKSRLNSLSAFIPWMIYESNTFHDEFGIVESNSSSKYHELGFFNNQKIFLKYKFNTNSLNNFNSMEYFSDIISDVVEYLSYDNYGNPLEVKKQNLPSTVYLWGYNGQYPVAKIENATHAEVLAALGGGTVATTKLTALNAVNVTESTINSTIASIRSDTRMAKSLVSSYTYKPLIGMASKTDARGITEYYEFDGFQRLKEVLDFDKNVLKEYQYHYRPN